MMGDTGGERVWSFLGARYGRLGSVGSHTDRFIYIAMVEELSKARGSVSSHLNTVAPGKRVCLRLASALRVVCLT